MGLRGVRWRLGAGCLLVLLGAGAEGGEPPSLRLEGGQSEYLRLEPILLTLKVEGAPGAALPPAPGGEGPSAASALRFEVEPPVKPRPAAKPLPGEAATANQTLASRTYDLLEWFQFPDHGEFTVRAVYEHGGDRVVSAPLTLRIASPKQGDADFDAVARVHHIPWSNYETNAFCGDTFDVVQKWPASKLAKYCHYWNGRYSQNKKEYEKAIASYRIVLDKYPGCPLAGDARRALAECEKANTH
ncbi:MAG: hypothetical protein P4L84_18400 [Isosphaeraceae bacterium]|nr:hypothetical protein [Isosphaeraceae bacterium]